MAFDATPVTVDNGENTDYTAAVRSTTVGKIVGCQVDIGEDTTPSPVTPTNPLPVYLAATSSLTEGNIISEGPITAATIDGAGAGGVNLIIPGASILLSIFIANQLSTETEISFDGGSTWVTLFAAMSPNIEWGNFGRKKTQNIKIRKKGATTVDGNNIMAWGKI